MIIYLIPYIRLPRKSSESTQSSPRPLASGYSSTFNSKSPQTFVTALSSDPSPSAKLHNHRTKYASPSKISPRALSAPSLSSLQPGSSTSVKRKDRWSCSEAPRPTHVGVSGGSSGIWLHVACQEGNETVVCMLLAAGRCNVDDLDESGKTGLHRAAWAGHLEIVRLLVEKYKADTSVRDNDNMTPLEYAVKLRMYVDAIVIVMSAVFLIAKSSQVSHKSGHARADAGIFVSFKFTSQCSLNG